MGEEARRAQIRINKAQIASGKGEFSWEEAAKAHGEHILSSELHLPAQHHNGSSPDSASSQHLQRGSSASPPGISSHTRTAAASTRQTHALHHSAVCLVTPAPRS